MEGGGGGGGSTGGLGSSTWGLRGLNLCSSQVSVGGCGMWGVAKDNSLWFRVGTAGRTGEWAGDNWTKVFPAL